MKLKLNEAINLLQNEIIWCLDHPDPELNKDQQLGFMNGLRQAQYLIQKAEKQLIIEKSRGQGFSENEPNYSEGEWR
jgi:hypothetical protein